jgi:hypothetical protein
MRITGGMIGQSGEHVREPSLWIDVVELGGLDQGVDGGGALATFVGTGKGLNISLTRKAWSCVRHFPGETQSKDPAGIVAPVR